MNPYVNNTASQVNKGGGIYLFARCTTINNNDLYGNMTGSPANTPNDLFNGNDSSAPEVNAENNYWGTTDPNVIEDHIWHSVDDPWHGVVDYIPYRTTPVGPTACTVTSPVDSGPGTLRQCLRDARAGDTITFDPAVFPPASPATIALSSKLPHIAQGNLTIDANDAGVILDGSNSRWGGPPSGGK